MIGFPGAAGDTSFASLAASLSPGPPPDTANGDLLLAFTSGRAGAFTTADPAWTPVIASFSTATGIGAGAVFGLPVPSAAALPPSWTFTFPSARSSILIMRATGVNLAAPYGGQAASFNPSGNASLPVGSVASGGAAITFAFTYFNEVDLCVPASPFGTGPWPVLQNVGITGAANRQCMVTAGGPDNGAGATQAYTVNITTAQWPIDVVIREAGAAVLGLVAAAAPPSGGPVAMAAGDSDRSGMRRELIW